MKPGRVRFVCSKRVVQRRKGNKMFTAMLQWADPPRATDKSPCSTTAQCFLPHTHTVPKVPGLTLLLHTIVRGHWVKIRIPDSSFRSKGQKYRPRPSLEL